MPLTLKQSLVDIFHYTSPTIYYSLYSTNSDWREKWMPGAMPVVEALSLLKEYQDFSKKIIKIHYPFIDGQNDSEQDIYHMCQLISEINLHCDFNLVRYNPASSDQGFESPESRIKRNTDIIAQEFKFNGKVQVIPRVGFDVKASCGMFVE